jgi:hypothetical protein
MNTKLLIDAITRQTVVLIAQISTVGGVRAPLAHLADQVFVSLAREIEAQGLARKVVADMFGMALRTYQRRTQRLAESASDQGKTLTEAVLEYVETSRGVTRAMVLKRFRHDGERETRAVLSDLVHSGLLYATGSGQNTLYGTTSDAERQRLTRHTDGTALQHMIVSELYRAGGGTETQLAERFDVSAERIAEAIAETVRDGRVTREPDGILRARTFQIDESSEAGWESAVFDHFHAVAVAIASKLQLKARDDENAKWVGGSTLRFELHSKHPARHEVLELLASTRRRINDLWQRVADYNDAHPHPEEERVVVSFYFGQNVNDSSRAHELADDAPTATRGEL